ncbi:hypothetical protein A3K28_02220 [Candidatus Azambacteria bacterium RIFOXYB1_FULL_40_33]|nr:MAG: hypothetical protein A3K28_02220 [Candidatus Azambacteria bacterium RIFOXYB1_FULL_40_33]OGD42975.1 MAG: hypothetical protein A3I82_02160 [Candidatus Azambacteria bacterium RIFCSPLOWO2_02_FULL_42_10]
MSKKRHRRRQLLALSCNWILPRVSQEDKMKILMEVVRVVVHACAQAHKATKSTKGELCFPF